MVVICSQDVCVIIDDRRRVPFHHIHTLRCAIIVPNEHQESLSCQLCIGIILLLYNHIITALRDKSQKIH